MRQYHVRLMVSVLVSLSAVTLVGDSGRVAIAQSAAEMVAQTDAEALLEEGKTSVGVVLRPASVAIPLGKFMVDRA